MIEGWIAEAELAASLLPGETTRDSIREMRREHMTEGDDFKIARREIHYSVQGVKKMLALLGLPDALAGSVAASNPVPANTMPGDGTEAGRGKTGGAATVTRVWPGNPRYFMARLAGEEITVCARETRNFAIGMEIREELLKRRGPGYAIYDFVGRCPRGRGRW